MNTHIKSLSATSGFLEHCQIEFHPQFTCIIGARGTCKSTLIESIRFVFDSDPAKIAILTSNPNNHSSGESCSGLITATLGAGSVRCQVEHGENKSSVHILERELSADTRIYQDGVREHVNDDIMHHIEIFSQGDLQKIAEDGGDELRLALVDRPNASNIKKLLDTRAICAAKLTSIGPELRLIRSKISALRQELQVAPELAEQLKQAELACPQLSPELEASRIAFEQRSRLLDSLAEAVTIQQNAIQIIPSLTEHIAKLSSILTVCDEQGLPEVLPAIAKTRQMHTLFCDIMSYKEQVIAVALNAEVMRIAKLVEEMNEPYYRLRQEEQTANDSLKKQQLLRRQIKHMESTATELKSAVAREAEFVQRRAALRAEIEEIDNQVYCLRVQEVETINNEQASAIHLTLATGMSSRVYANSLSAMLGGSRIRSQDEVAIALAQTYGPSTLVDLVESGNAQALADVLGRDLGQMNRVVSHLSDHPELHTLEAQPPATRLEITMFDGGQPKPVETLSKGQRATALLPLILRPLPYPLLFDQPEDDLDNSFVFNFLVKAIGQLKTKRQLIFVTHNANIPVLGDADKVIVMSMKTPLSANGPKMGTVDECKEEILNLLEGGAKAFLERQARYDDLLHQPDRS